MKYYQMKNQEPSYIVWNSYQQCLEDNNCNKEDVRAFEDNEIEVPKFMDIDDYHNQEIAVFLKRKLLNNEVDIVRSFLEINGKDYKQGMTEFLDYVSSDKDFDNFTKKLSENIFFVVIKNKFYTISLTEYTEKELEEFVSSHYSEGLVQIKKDYGNMWKQFVAEIIAENK